jgi:predicted phosphodiesterase
MDNGSIPSIRFVFRYRDLVSKTILEHQKVIAENKSCWWGWWKRPKEDNRIKVWNELKCEASEEKPVPVGLFNSGTGKVYIARVTEVIPPNLDMADGQHPRVPSGKEKLIPPYYRESPFSFAWMRFKKIGNDAIDFFGNYTFDEVPNLPYYSKEILKQFYGKLIVDEGELRAMDTTIWVVKRLKDRDKDLHSNKLFHTTRGPKTVPQEIVPQKIVLHSPSISEPVSDDVIKAEGKTILHISDPHYAFDSNRRQHVWALEGEGSGASTMVEAIYRTLERKNEEIGLVLVTGDLTFCGDKEEYNEANKGLIRLLGQLDLGKENLVVVPGNHDILWTEQTTYNEKAEVQQAPTAATSNYREFHKNLLGHEPNQHLSMGRRYLFPSGVSVEIAALNSSSLETGKNFLAGMGRVQEAAFAEVANTLKWGNGNSSLALRILALHHHLTLTENLEPAGDYYRGFGIAVDAVRIQRLAAKYGVQLAVHGHKHRAFIWRSGVYELLENAEQKYSLGELSIIGGGSAGSSETENAKNFFNLLDITASGIELRSFRSQNCGMFENIKKCTARFAFPAEQPGLLLSDWIVK